MEHFNAGNPPLYYADYPGSEFPHQCGGGYGYGGHGDYAVYGQGCGGSPGAGPAGGHQPGCQCPTCMAPYSMPYKAGQAACGNPNCNCANCDGNCKCGAAGAVASAAAAALAPTGAATHGLLQHSAFGFDIMDLVKYAVMAVVAFYVFSWAMRFLRKMR